MVAAASLAPLVPSDQSLLIDVSKWQRRPDWTKVFAWRGPLGEHIVAAINKVSEGNADFPDPEFNRNWTTQKDLGKRRGLYHYGRPDRRHANDAIDEADRIMRLIEKAGGFRPGLDFAALDIEDTETPLYGAEFDDWCATFCERGTVNLGALVGIYTGKYYFDAHDGSPELDPAMLARLKRLWLWIAAYTRDSAAAQALAKQLVEWHAQGFTLHQISGSIAGPGQQVLHVDGIAGPVDRTLFPGDETAFNAWVEKLAAVEAPPTVVWDLTTPKGIQIALVALGYRPGPIDGVMGPITAKAIRFFQASHDLTVDGIVGPKTRAALTAALADLEG